MFTFSCFSLFSCININHISLSVWMSAVFHRPFALTTPTDSFAFISHISLSICINHQLCFICFFSVAYINHISLSICLTYHLCFTFSISVVAYIIHVSLYICVHHQLCFIFSIYVVKYISNISLSICDKLVYL